MANLGTYNSGNVSIYIAGTLMNGLDTDSFLTIEPNSDLFSNVIGADGEVARVRMNDNSFNMTMTLLQTSNKNDFLHALAKVDVQTNDGTFTVVVVDTSGTTLISSDCAYISKLPSVEYSTDIGSREWNFVLPRIASNSLIGGNSI